MLDLDLVSQCCGLTLFGYVVGCSSKPFRGWHLLIQGLRIEGFIKSRLPSLPGSSLPLISLTISSSVVCVSETHLNSSVIPIEVNISGYTMLRLDCKSHKLEFWWRWIQIGRKSEIMWVNVNQPNKFYVIGLVFNLLNIKISLYVDYCLEFLKI